MTFAFTQLKAADTAQAQAAWQQQMAALTSGTVGIPKPKWPNEKIRGVLVQEAAMAGNDYNENCSIAIFLFEYSDQFDYIPPAVASAFTNPPAGLTGICYKEAVELAQKLQSKVEPAPSVGEVPASAYPTLAALDDTEAIKTLLEATRPGAIQVATAATARLLESVTAPGDEGAMFLGTLSGGRLGADRTIVEGVAVTGQTVTVRSSVNLRALGTDTNYRQHSVFRVLPAGTRVTIETVSSPTSHYAWARVRVASVGGR
jgi:hypothetical protein